MGHKKEQQQYYGLRMEFSRFITLLFNFFIWLFIYFSLQGGKEMGSGVPKEGPVVDFNGIRCILCNAGMINIQPASLAVKRW